MWLMEELQNPDVNKQFHIVALCVYLLHHMLHNFRCLYLQYYHMLDKFPVVHFD